MEEAEMHQWLTTTGNINPKCKKKSSLLKDVSKSRKINTCLKDRIDFVPSPIRDFHHLKQSSLLKFYDRKLSSSQCPEYLQSPTGKINKGKSKAVKGMLSCEKEKENMPGAIPFRKRRYITDPLIDKEDEELKGFFRSSDLIMEAEDLGTQGASLDINSELRKDNKLISGINFQGKNLTKGFLDCTQTVKDSFIGPQFISDTPEYHQSKELSASPPDSLCPPSPIRLLQFANDTEENEEETTGSDLEAVRNSQYMESLELSPVHLTQFTETF